MLVQKPVIIPNPLSLYNLQNEQFIVGHNPTLEVVFNPRLRHPTLAVSLEMHIRRDEIQWGLNIVSIQAATAPSFPPSLGSSVATRSLPTRSQTECTLPSRVPHVPWLPVVRVFDRSGSQRLCAVFPPDRRRRRPRKQDENEETKKGHVALQCQLGQSPVSVQAPRRE